MADPLQDLETIRVASVRRWAAKCERRIADRLADARVHAWNAITRRAEQADDGRATLRMVVGTRGHKAAQNRMAELAASLLEAIQAARASFYRESHELLKGSVPPEIAAPNAGPSKAGEREAKAIVVHGAELKDEIGASVAEASRNLTAAITYAAGTGLTDRTAATALETWEGRWRDRLTRLVETILSDSEVAIFNRVGHELIAEEFHAE